MTPPNDRLDRIERTLAEIAEIQRRTDVRLDRLTERHEALAESMELSHHEWEERWQKISAELQQDAENIRALARIAETHERRLSRLEGTE